MSDEAQLFRWNADKYPVKLGRVQAVHTRKQFAEYRAVFIENGIVAILEQGVLLDADLVPRYAMFGIEHTPTRLAGNLLPMPQNDDILMWPDGFWCFRDELRSGFMRDHEYSVIEVHTAEWLERTRQDCDLR